MDGVRGPRARALPWVACDLPLEPGIEGVDGTGRVTGLSMDAVRLDGVHGLAAGAEVRLGFRLPGQKAPTVIRGRVTSPHAADGPLEITIEDFEKGSDRLFHQYVLARVGADALARQADALTTPAGCLVPLSEPDRIRDLLADSLAYKADALVQGPELPQPVRALLTGVTLTEILLTSESSMKGEPLAGTRVRCSLLSRHGPYLFEADVRSRTGGQLRLSFPERLHQYEKRAGRRVRFSPVCDVAERGPDPAAAAHVPPSPNRIVIRLPDTYGGALERPLLDVSDGGAAFLAFSGDPLFLPGTPLPSVALVLEGAAGAPRHAEVRQVTREAPGKGGPAAIRVGLALDVQRGGVLAPAVHPASPARVATSGDGWRARAVAGVRHLLGRSLSDGIAGRARAAWLRARSGPPAPLVNVVRYRTRAGEPIVALLNTSRPVGGATNRLKGPLVVIPPAYGKTKETYCALAMLLTDTFARQGRDVVVVRYDGIRAPGESHKDPDDWADGRHMMRYTLSQAVADLLATLDYFHGRAWFRPTHTVVVSFSIAALPARRAILEDPAGRVTHWLSVVGAPDAQEVIFNATGGIDLIGGHQLGIRFGVMPILGHLGEVDRFAADAVASGLATLVDARRDLARIGVPVTWFVGRDDRWVRTERVQDVMSVAAPAPRTVLELPVGHTLRSSAEAIASFETITRHLWTQLYGTPPAGTALDESRLRRVAALERDRLPRRRVEDPRRYWEQYLLGEDGRGTGFDLWSTTPAYQELMDLQRQLLDVAEGDVVADLGAGTGGFTEQLLLRLVDSGFRTTPRRIIVTDLVPRALDLARREADRVLEAIALPLGFLEFRELNLETSRLRPIRRFLAGEFASADRLRGLVEGLSDSTLDAWIAVYDDRLHAWLRGAAPDGPIRDHVARTLKGEPLETALEFNRAARWVLGLLGPSDARPGLDAPTAKALADDPRLARPHQLRFDRLRLDGPGLDDALPFADASLDRAVLSLVLSYLFDPLETLREVYRALKPGGRVVASTMRPDTDLSPAVEELVAEVKANPAAAARHGLSPEELTRALQQYLNQAATILDLAEGGVFRFFSRTEMTAMLEEAGFVRVKVYESFGRTPMAFVAVGVKP